MIDAGDCSGLETGDYSGLRGEGEEAGGVVEPGEPLLPDISSDMVLAALGTDCFGDGLMAVGEIDFHGFEQEEKEEEEGQTVFQLFDPAKGVANVGPFKDLGAHKKLGYGAGRFPSLDLGSHLGSQGGFNHMGEYIVSPGKPGSQGLQLKDRQVDNYPHIIGVEKLPENNSLGIFEGERFSLPASGADKVAGLTTKPDLSSGVGAVTTLKMTSHGKQPLSFVRGANSVPATESNTGAVEVAGSYSLSSSGLDKEPGVNSVEGCVAEGGNLLKQRISSCSPGKTKRTRFRPAYDKTLAETRECESLIQSSRNQVIVRHQVCGEVTSGKLTKPRREPGNSSPTAGPSRSGPTPVSSGISPVAGPSWSWYNPAAGSRGPYSSPKAGPGTGNRSKYGASVSGSIPIADPSRSKYSPIDGTSWTPPGILVRVRRPSTPRGAGGGSSSRSGDQSTPRLVYIFTTGKSTFLVDLEVAF